MKNVMMKSAATVLVWAIAVTTLLLPVNRAEAASIGATENVGNMYFRPAKNFDLNLSSAVAGLRTASSEQLQALNNLKAASSAPNMTVRWNAFGGSPDVVYDFASQPFEGTPEEAGRAFIAQNAAVFGVSSLEDVKLFSQREALGGYMVRFKQTFAGLDVQNGGIGVVMNANKQVVMASGPFFRGVNVNTTPNLSAEQARGVVNADLAQARNGLLDSVTNLMQPALDVVSHQTQAVSNLQPKLGIYPTADGYKLVWKIAQMSTNPFGLYLYSVDAHNGQIVARKDFVNFQQNPVHPFTADIFPKYPTITPELKDQSIISDCNGTPCGQERVKLRSFDQQNVATGLNGTLTGAHALVNNVLPTKQPFAQAALGTWHFRQNNPTNFEGRTNEQDQFAEPAEHQDEINAFFFVTYLLEYIDYLHVGGDNRNGLPGKFPDEYPNKTIPLPATVHMPNIYAVLPLASCSPTNPAACPIPSPTDPDLRLKLLGMDNAFALNVTSLIEGLSGEKSPVVVNPTFYGHGYLLNDLALEGTVPYHEGMHAITSPIAGLEGEEGGALNEGQADMWAFTITDNASLGDYVVNAKGYRQRFRDRGRNPDSVAYIRSARSTLKYSDIATYNNAGNFEFEEHRDGEIYMSTMWDIREMMNRVYPQATTHKRPRPSDGQALKAITKGTEIFERDFLGSMYILGTTAPDTLVKSRDAMIVADQMLYPTDPTDADAPGKHRAMIEQIFAAKELGVNAVEVTGGKATISTQVTPFVGEQAAPAVPSGITVSAATPRSLRVNWNAVNGAVSYQILKRKIGFENRRQPNGKREFNDGDASTTGFRHVAFVDGNQTSFEDKGEIYEVFAPIGISDLFNHEYVVRAVGVNSTGQLGFSNLSGSTKPIKAEQNLTAQIDSAISNISFNNGVMAFDNKLTNSRGALSSDKTVYSPIKFEITNISNPTVSVRNADQNGNAFIYNQTLALGQTSTAKRLEFNDPAAQMFSFDAKITGNAFTSSTVGTGTQNPDGTSNPPAPVTYSIFRENKSGALVAGEPTSIGGASATWGNPAFKGITWDDIPVTTKSDALFLEATLSALTVDLDFELRTIDGEVLSDSASATASEFVSSAVRPNTTYILRVKGWASGPTTFNIVSDQLLPNNSPNANAGTRSTGGSGTTSGSLPTGSLTRLVRFTVNPLTGQVTSQLLQ